MAACGPGPEASKKVINLLNYELVIDDGSRKFTALGHFEPVTIQELKANRK